MKVIDPVFRFFESWIDPFKARDGYEPPNTLLNYIWHYVGQVRWAFALLLAYGFVNAFVEAGVFVFIGYTIDILTTFDQSGEKPLGWAALLEAHGTTLLAMASVVVLIRFIVVTFGALIEEQVIVPGFFTLMRWQSHKHVIGQSLAYFQNDLAGRISQKVLQSGMATGDMMIALFQVIIFIVVYAFTTAGLLSTLDWRLGAIVIIWMLGFSILARVFIPQIRKRGAETAEAASLMTGRMVDSYTHIQTVKLGNSVDVENDWVLEAATKQFNALRKFTRLLTGFRSSLMMMNGIFITLIAWFVIDLWLADHASLGEVAISLGLSLRMHLLSGRLMGQLNGLFRNIGTIQNTMETVAQSIDLKDERDAPDFEFEAGKIEFRKVSFQYAKSSPLLENFNLTVKPGEKIGLVGPSGAGKTTVINLILRFYDIQSGQILIDDQDIRSVTQASLRKHFALVQQDSSLFHRSVAQNIAYGCPDASTDEILNAAKLANAHEFISTLVDKYGREGYDAQVGERGVKLSGGQRQRLTIARAFLKNAPVLLLDEATSQLDSDSEAIIQKNLSRLMQGKTVIAIAHRLSTIAAMDRLIVIDDGRIVDQGTHEQLLRRDGLYASLWKRQSGTFLKTTQ